MNRRSFLRFAAVAPVALPVVMSVSAGDASAFWSAVSAYVGRCPASVWDGDPHTEIVSPGAFQLSLRDAVMRSEQRFNKTLAARMRDACRQIPDNPPVLRSYIEGRSYYRVVDPVLGGTA